MELETLKDIAEECKSEYGRDSIRINGTLFRLCAKLNSSKLCVDTIPIIKCLRNACGGNLENAMILANERVIEVMYNNIISWHDSSNTDNAILFTDVMNMALQLFVNFCGCGNPARSHFWECIGTKGLLNLLVISTSLQFTSFQGIVIATLYYCILGNETECISRRQEALRCNHINIHICIII
jgi:hypothetical protein